MNAISFKLSTKKRAQAEALQAGPDWVSRRAKLFEAGEYADKGVTVTNEDLLQLAQSFAAPLPVLVEHSDSPLEIGLLTSVEALGPELFGTVSLTPEANALVERSGARSLSVGIAADLSVIREISLVRNPRVATAQLFAGEVRFGGALIEQEAAAPTQAGWKGKPRGHSVTMRS